MASIAGGTFEEQKDYDPMTSAFVVDTVELVDIEQMGYSSEKGHGLNNTIDNNAVTVDNVPRVSATAAVYATSEAINGLRALYNENKTFDAIYNPSDDAGDQQISLIACRIQDYDRSNVEIDGIPTFTVNIEGYDTSASGSGSNLV